MKIIISISLLTVLFAGFCLVNGQTPAGKCSLDIKEKAQRDKAVKSVITRRQSDIKTALSVATKYIKDPLRVGTARSAVELLGELRAEEAVNLLAENITFKAFYKSSKRPQPAEDLYPAIKALSRIGMKSIDPVLKKACAEPGEEVTDCSARVIFAVLGKDLAKKLLDQQIANASSAKQKTALVALGKRVQSL